MNITFPESYTVSHSKSTSQLSAWARFMAWCEHQEENRFLWLAVALAGHGCFLTPLTLLAVMLTGNSMLFWAIAIGAMTMAVITNLAALSVKITIPVFFISVIIDLGIIVSSIVSAFIVAG